MKVNLCFILILSGLAVYIPFKVDIHPHNSANRKILNSERQISAGENDDLTVVSKVSDRNSGWVRQRIRLRTNFNLIAGYFITHRKGWVIDSESTIFKTTNGGNKWNKLPINPPDNFVFSDILPISESSGWLILKNKKADGSNLLAFFNELGKGFEKLSVTNPTEPLNYRFTDGNNPRIVAEAVNSNKSYIIYPKRDQSFIYDASHLESYPFKGHFIFKDEKIVRMEENGYLASSVDKGGIWKEIRFPISEFETASISYFNILNRSKYIAVGGADSREVGRWSSIVTGDERSWLIANLGDIYISEISISPNSSEIVAIGSGYRETKIDFSKMKFRHFLLLTHNYGKDWQVLISGKEELNGIKFIENDKIICFGTRGKIFLLNKVRKP